MADCDVKRVTVPYFFRMIADQKNSPKLSFPPVPPGSLPKLSMQFSPIENFLNCDSLCLKHASSLFLFLVQELSKEKRNIFSPVSFPQYLTCAIVIRISFIREMFVTQLFCISPCFDEIKTFAVFFQLNMW